jgi:hypothetical protein
MHPNLAVQVTLMIMAPSALTIARIEAKEHSCGGVLLMAVSRYSAPVFYWRDQCTDACRIRSAALLTIAALGLCVVI